MNVDEMQRKLSLWSDKDKDKQFKDLFNLVSNKDWLSVAYEKVKRNAGSVTGGVDGIAISDFNRDLERQLDTIHQALRTGTFQPQPVRSVSIPKANGKSRRLGIPTVKDRIVQESLRMVLEPIFESDFFNYSYGFRPNRRTLHAIRYVHNLHQNSKKYFWTVEGDIASYFDTVNHRKLMKLVKRRITDAKVLNLLWTFLKAGVMENKLFKDSQSGVPQGGIISPLLANIYLHELDKYMWENHIYKTSGRRRWDRDKRGIGSVKYIRYADDFLVLTNGRKDEALALKEEVKLFLKDKLKLTLSDEKTKVTHINDGYEFLGFELIRKDIGKVNPQMVFKVPHGAIKRMKTKLGFALSKSTYNDSIVYKILAVNRILRGWGHYYKYAYANSIPFKKIDQFTFWSMAHWLARKHNCSIPKIMRMYYRNNTFIFEGYRLFRLGSLKHTRAYDNFLNIANPYLENLPVKREQGVDDRWSGVDGRGLNIRDLKPQLLRNTKSRCQNCDVKVSTATSHLDHIKPRHKFKKPELADVITNLQILCITCHRNKTGHDLSVESRVLGN